MGIVNLTDDSFSGDGLRGHVDAAVAQGMRLVEEGADILDLGAESSRPGAVPVPAQQELERLLPVIDALRDCGVPLSVDTVKPEVMRAALAAGADMINDIAALQRAGRAGRGGRTPGRRLPDAHAGAAAQHAGRSALRRRGGRGRRVSGERVAACARRRHCP